MSGWLAAVLGAAAVVVAGWRRDPLDSPRRRDRAGPQRRPGRLLSTALAGGLGSMAVAAGMQLVPTAAAAAATGLVVIVRRRQARSRAIDRRRAAVVDLTYAVAAELRAGRTPIEAVQLTTLVAAADPQWRAAIERDLSEPGTVDGSGLTRSAAAAVPGAERVRYLLAALEIAQSSGGRVVTALERLGAAMDADEELRQELDAALAGPRASMVLLAGLPALGIGLGQAMGAAPLRILLHRPLGWGLLAAGTVLDLTGVGLVRLITRSALRS